MIDSGFALISVVMVILTHYGWMMNIDVSKLGHHWFREPLVACIVEWTIGKKFCEFQNKMQQF